MNMTPEKYINRLNELLLKKRVLLLDILELTQAQTGAITEDGLESLNNLISSKQVKIDGIDKLDDEFGTYYQRLKSTLGITHLDQLDTGKLDGNASEGAKQLKGLTVEILDIIRRIKDIEEENNHKSNRLMEQFGSEIKKINQGKKANNAYNPGPFKTQSYFVDKKK